MLAEEAGTNEGSFPRPTFAEGVVAVRKRKMEETQHLLGDTIRLSDKEWQSPSLLPGWTRAHVATHLARNADGLRRSVDAFLSGRSARMYTSEMERQEEMERGSQRTGLDLQIDLDTSASQLNAVMNRLAASSEEDLAREVELRAGFHVPAWLIATARLNEVVLHHVDLGIGFTIDQVDDDIARWLLEWMVFRLDDRMDVPRLELQSTSGVRARIGGFGEPTVVNGADRFLLGWLTGRCDSSKLEGADQVVLPLVG